MGKKTAVANNRVSEVRGSVRRTCLLVGVALCTALFVFVGCPDGDTAPPVITLTGSEFVVLSIGDTFTDPDPAVDVDVSNNQPAYTGTVTTVITDSDGATVTTIDTATRGVYTITYTAMPDGVRNTPATVTRTVRVGGDADGDNRTDINFLEDLDAVRADFTGTYELTRDLDFADGDSYTDGTVNPAWRPDATDPDSATNEGWAPIGTGAAPFSGMFFGNDFAISNLYVRGSGRVGLFGLNSGAIQRIGVVDANIYGAHDGQGIGGDTIGGLAGSNPGTITASYALGGSINGGDARDTVGGLVGTNAGTITASYATGDVNGRSGSTNDVGGLAGSNPTGRITASYATGDVDGGDGTDTAGGLVGSNHFGRITASYATGDVDGGAGNSDSVGGLIGLTFSSRITASYATGDVDGGAGMGDSVGGLAGANTGAGTITASYGFGTVTGETVGMPRSTNASPPRTVADACDITQVNSATTGTDWRATQWDFGDDKQRPIVRHNDAIVDGQTDRGC